MIPGISRPKRYVQILAVLMFLLVSVSSGHARMVTQIMPTLTITEEYSDNYLKTDTNTQEEFITSYGLGFSVGFLDKKSQIYLEYNPEYRDHKNLNEQDGLEHNASLTGSFQPTKHTALNADLGYDGHSGNNEGQSWAHTASAGLLSQLTKYTDLSLSHAYIQSFDQQVRTGNYLEHATNTSDVGLRKKFGEKNAIGTHFSYMMDDYVDSDADEHTQYSPSAFIHYWFTRLDGMESNIEYDHTKFDNTSSNDYETYAGDIRYIKRFSRHFDGYVKYRHSLSQREDGDHEIYHPSVGFDWLVTEDSGISLGIGVLFHEWDNNNDDSMDPFLDIDAYKVFNFSRLGSLAITGSSGYEESSEEAASLGYSTYYQGGFSLDYQLLKQMSSSVFGSYRIQEFQEQAVDRQDDTMEIGAGFTWLPLRWMVLNLSGSHLDYNTDALRGDYKENRVTFFVRLVPETPIRPDKIISRNSLEKQIFQR